MLNSIPSRRMFPACSRNEKQSEAFSRLSIKNMNGGIVSQIIFAKRNINGESGTSLQKNIHRNDKSIFITDKVTM